MVNRDVALVIVGAGAGGALFESFSQPLGIITMSVGTFVALVRAYESITLFGHSRTDVLTRLCSRYLVYLEGVSSPQWLPRAQPDIVTVLTRAERAQ